MVNRVRQVLSEMGSDENTDEERRRQMLRIEFMSYNASALALEQVIEWLEELVDLTKLLRGSAEFGVGLLSRPTYREWVSQIHTAGEDSQYANRERENKNVDKIQVATRIPTSKNLVTDRGGATEQEDLLPDSLKRVQSRHRDIGLARQVSQNKQLSEEIAGLRKRKERANI